MNKNGYQKESDHSLDDSVIIGEWSHVTDEIWFHVRLSQSGAGGELYSDVYCRLVLELLKTLYLTYKILLL